MTTITTSANTTATMNPSQIMQAQNTAQEFVFAAGIMGKMLNPLNAGPWASAQLPSQWMATLYANAEPQGQWTASTGSDGQASIDLGDGYSLQLDENSSSATITNANTGETTQIYGDPHVNVNGEHKFDFYGTTTFTLGNGTKITVNTEQSKTNPDVYYAQNLTITKGSQGMTVTGLSEQTKGDLSITMGQDGFALDNKTADGYVLDEKSDGTGWTSAATGEDATQADLDTTKPGNEALQTLQQLGHMFSQFLATGLLFGVVGAMGGVAREAMHASQQHARLPDILI